MRLAFQKFGFKPMMFTSLVLLISVFWGCKKDPKTIEEPFTRYQGNNSVESKIYNRQIGYSVLLPENYNTSTDSYPVVYLLHGYGDDQFSWSKYGLIKYYSDQDVTENGPMIFVMPLGYNTYYVNKYNGGTLYMDFFTKELVPHIDSVYRTIKDKEHRAVMGYSMGGYGALILPSKNPDIFQTAVVLSMSFRTDSQYVDEPQWVFDSQWGPIFGATGASGNARLTDYFLANSPFHYFQDQGPQAFNGLNLFIDCGDDEETLSETNGALHNVLRDLNISHEYRMKNGGHSWDYWHPELREGLKYIGYAFRGVTYPSEPEPADAGEPVPADRIKAEQVEGGLSYNVILPDHYSEGESQYPVIIILHDRDVESGDYQSQKLYSLLTKKMAGNGLPYSLVMEIPDQLSDITSESLHQALSHFGEKYRAINSADHTVILGNRGGGLAVYNLMADCTDISKAFLLFDADLPGEATASITDESLYLDICEEGSAYQGYHSLYMSLRNRGQFPEYRVRQGTPSHESFLNGLDIASGFINNHLKK